MTLSWRRRPIHGERGAFLLLFALALLVIFTFVAFAVDLGQARASQRANRSTVDLAALSAGYWLAGGEFTGTQPVADAKRACVAAVESVRTNESSFQPTQDVAAVCATLPACNQLSPPATQPPPVSFSDSRFVLEIQYPVLDGVAGGLDDSRFSGAGLNDGSDPCERMRITLDRTDDVAFAGVIGVTSLHTTGTVVVKGDIEDPLKNAIPAFLILERTDCGSIATSVGTGDGITVKSTINLDGEPQPGYMHSDSDCSTGFSGETQDAYAIYGGNSSTPESIILEPYTDANGTVDGIVESRAPNATGAGGHIRGIYRIGGLISRQPADDIYRAGLTGIHSSADSQLDGIDLLDDVSADAAGYDVFGCTGGTATADPALSEKAFIFCDDFDADLTLHGYEEVGFSGHVGLNGGRDVTLPDATDIVIKGSADMSGGGSNQSVFDAPAAQNVAIGDGLTVPNNGVFSINRGGPAPLTTASESPTCPARAVNDTTIGNTARVVVFSPAADPAVDVAGNLTLCETTLYLAGDRSDDYARKITASGTDPSGGECSATLPCPLPSASPGARYFFAAGANVKLVGPNTSTTPAPTIGGWPWSTGQDGGVEDLAFWTEGGGISDVRGGAVLIISGVFSAPNGTLEFRSGPANTNPVDAQYIAREVKMFAGRLDMKPTSSNTVSVPVPGSFTLIR